MIRFLYSSQICKCQFDSDANFHCILRDLLRFLTPKDFSRWCLLLATFRMQLMVLFHCVRRLSIRNYMLTQKKKTQLQTCTFHKVNATQWIWMYWNRNFNTSQNFIRNWTNRNFLKRIPSTAIPKSRGVYEMSHQNLFESKIKFHTKIEKKGLNKDAGLIFSRLLRPNSIESMSMSKSIDQFTWNSLQLYDYWTLHVFYWMFTNSNLSRTLFASNIWWIRLTTFSVCSFKLKLPRKSCRLFNTLTTA